MTIALPGPIAAYLAADRGSGAHAVAACFTSAAVVKDDDHTYVGRDAIRRWEVETDAKYSCTVKAIAVEERGGRTIVTNHVSGNFPGSPIDMRYAFVLAGDEIAELEITA